MIFALFLPFILATIFVMKVDYGIDICATNSIPLAVIHERWQGYILKHDKITLWKKDYAQ